MEVVEGVRISAGCEDPPAVGRILPGEFQAQAAVGARYHDRGHSTHLARDLVSGALTEQRSHKLPPSAGFAIVQIRDMVKSMKSTTAIAIDRSFAFVALVFVFLPEFFAAIT